MGTDVEHEAMILSKQVFIARATLRVIGYACGDGWTQEDMRDLAVEALAFLDAIDAANANLRSNDATTP